MHKRPGCAAVVLICAPALLTVRAAQGATATWSGGSGVDTRWENSNNWSPRQIPDSTSDVVLGPIAITPNYRIDAEGSQNFVFLPPPGRFVFLDPQLVANSLTINTVNHPFTLDGRFAGMSPGGFAGAPGTTTLTPPPATSPVRTLPALRATNCSI